MRSAAHRAAVAFLILALGAGNPATAQEAPEEGLDELRAELDEIVRDHLDTHHVPGLAVGVVREGRVVLAEGYGIADPETGRAVSARSLFHVASVSKTFVATAVLQLVEREEVDLDAPVTEYLSDFRLDDERVAKVTIRQMLSHTSGMPDVEDYGWEEPEHDEGALARYVRGLADRRLLFEPGERWSYSNMAYEVLGHLVAEVSGKPFETYVRERILDPLEMNSSTFLLRETDPELRTTPHVGRRAPEVSEVYPYHRAHAPSSTMHSSAEEMCRWILVHAKRGKLGEARILEEASWEEMWKPQVEVAPDRAMGLGWFLAESPFGAWAFHGGRDVGFRSHLTILPEQGGGLVILGNWSDLPNRPLREELMEVAFPEAR